MIYFLIVRDLEVSMYYFIVNPSANRGHGEKVWRKLECLLRHSEVEYEVYLTQMSGDAVTMLS